MLLLKRSRGIVSIFLHPTLVGAGCPDVRECRFDPRAADYRLHRWYGEGSDRRGGRCGQCEGNQHGNRIHPVGADQRLWGVPHRLPARGQVHVELEAAGFRRFVQENIVLNVDQTLTVEITLTVGASTETVTVTDCSPVGQYVRRGIGQNR